MKPDSFRCCWLALLLAAIPTARAEGYRTSLGTPPDAFPVVVVTGTPYEMGLSLGTLMKPEIQKFVPFFMGEAQGAGEADLSAANLDRAWSTMEPFMSARFKDELRGLAEGCGLPLAVLKRVQMIPVVSEYSCSGVAIWGAATRTGHLYQIRNLDYNIHAHLQDFPCVVIYIPKDGIAHLNPSFAGSIGCHTGMNAEGITLTEIGDSSAADKPYDLHGLHFMMMFRDILYSAHTLDQALQMIKDTPRIKKYHFVVGDGKIPAAVKIKAWAPNLEIWKDNDPKDELAPRVFPDVVYHAEGRDPTAFGHLSEYAHGRYDIDAVIQLSKAIGTLGGNLMNAVYDATAREAWLSYADKDQCAYRRPYVEVKLGDFIPYNPANPKVRIQQVDGKPLIGANER
jgi:isopenicillin-N N-acyltransferase like protein